MQFANEALDIAVQHQPIIPKKHHFFLFRWLAFVLAVKHIEVPFRFLISTLRTIFRLQFSATLLPIIVAPVARRLLRVLIANEAWRVVTALCTTPDLVPALKSTYVAWFTITSRQYWQTQISSLHSATLNNCSRDMQLPTPSQITSFRTK